VLSKTGDAIDRLFRPTRLVTVPTLGQSQEFPAKTAWAIAGHLSGVTGTMLGKEMAPV
jgi:hypothetical protein